MDNIDATDRTVKTSEAPPPSLLTVVLDTNPLSWSHLSSTLPLTSALQTILIFINAHLALNHANQVAVLASHVNHVAWLYPEARERINPSQSQTNGTSSSASKPPKNTNKYRPFVEVEEHVTRNLRQLIASTPASVDALSSPPLLAGALTIALTHANMQTMLSHPVSGDAPSAVASAPGAANLDAHTSALRSGTASLQLVSRILVISVSQADLSSQYIGLMNSVFAAQRLNIPVDVLRIGPQTAFLQQASDATNGVYMTYTPPGAVANGTNGVRNDATAAAAGLLQTLMMAYLPDVTARRSLVMPGSAEVDFRAACFCHGKVVDLGGVCSVCLSIFCLPLETTSCPTCQSPLKIPKSITTKPAVVPRKKKKKRKIGEGGRDSAVTTPAAGSTPLQGNGTPI